MAPEFVLGRMLFRSYEARYCVKPSLHNDQNEISCKPPAFRFNTCMLRNMPRSILRLVMVPGVLLPALSLSAAPAPSGVKDLNTPREFPKIESRQQWQKRANEIRENTLVSCGLYPLPERTPLNPNIFGRIDHGDYSVEKVYFQSYPGFFVAGNLYRPLGKGPGPFPGVLNPHGHWQDGRLADNNEGSIAARCINFARQGMVAFSWDMVGYNDTLFREAGDLPAEKQYSSHRRFGTNQADQLWNISLMGLQTWNSIRALDFLESLPEVDKKRLACTGESGGGTQTFMLGAIDHRLAVQAPVVMVSHSMQGGCSCENAPGLRVDYSNMELAAAPAPRPQILVAATGDWTRMTLTVEGPAVESIYRLFNATDRLKYVRYDFNHNYNQTSREAVYGWFDHWLLNRKETTPLQEIPYQKDPNSVLRVFPDSKLPPGAVTQQQLVNYLIETAEARLAAIQPARRADLTRFRDVMAPAWRHTVQLNWPVAAPQSSPAATPGSYSSGPYTLTPSDDPSATIQVVVTKPAKGKSSRAVILADSEPGSGPDADLVNNLVAQGWSVIQIAQWSPVTEANPFENFYTVYNRTRAQKRVGDLARAAAFARASLKARSVSLCGTGAAGLWALLAAPVADGVVADANLLDTTSESKLLGPDVFMPGLRKMGGFETAGILAAPHPLVLHNVGDKFAAQRLSGAYQAANASGRIRIDKNRLTSEEMARCIDRLK